MGRDANGPTPYHQPTDPPVEVGWGNGHRALDELFEFFKSTEGLNNPSPT
jgi:hypothetical protein